MSEIGKIIPLGGQALEPLWREVLGHRLRTLRADRDETLAQTAERAGISPQYLSEASSEMIAALAGALGITVADLMAGTADDLRQMVAPVFSVTGRAAPAGRADRSALHGSGPVALAMAA